MAPLLMEGVMKKAKAKAKATKAKAKKTKKAKAGKAGSSKKKAAAKKASPPGTKGCCTIIFDDGRKPEEVEGVSKTDCTRIARSRDGVGQWNKGSCA
jgi:hypothetical protein